jgi:hypothetical protein
MSNFLKTTKIWKKTAATEAYDAAMAMFQYGSPPDSNPWVGGPIKISMDFSDNEVTKITRRNNPDGSVTFVATFVFGKTGGFYADSFLIQRFLKAFPTETKTLENVFLDKVNSSLAKLEVDIQKWFKTQTWKPFGSIVGYRETEDWENPSLISFGNVELKKPQRGIFSRGILRVDVHVTAAIKATKKTPETKEPFSDMSDQELNDWIKAWEHYAPENFWMDGELKLTRPQAYAYYRNEWRSMSPRSQVTMYKQLGSQKRASLTQDQKDKTIQLLKDRKIPIPDKPVHDLADQMKVDTDDLESYIYGIAQGSLIDHIPGGLAEGKKPEDFNPKSIAQGVKVELEHTDDKAMAKEIAMDHLTENKNYYDELAKMESGQCKNAAKRVASRYFGLVK